MYIGVSIETIKKNHHRRYYHDSSSTSYIKRRQKQNEIETKIKTKNLVKIRRLQSFCCSAVRKYIRSFILLIIFRCRLLKHFTFPVNIEF